MRQDVPHAAGSSRTCFALIGLSSELLAIAPTRETGEKATSRHCDACIPKLKLAKETKVLVQECKRSFERSADPWLGKRRTEVYLRYTHS
ncbi:hypothetical protein PUN28_014039 [Cardiocondyla obscurior]|uniref:Uncharacterized protein n=1 Tax=Cardiocondyla obscurior TaxID=286306 RepID=A0AAW2F9D1_9HYME